MSSNVTTWCIVKLYHLLCLIFFIFHLYFFFLYISPFSFSQCKGGLSCSGLYECTLLEWFSSPILFRISALGVGDTDGSSI